MAHSYATQADLEAYLGAAWDVTGDPSRLLERATDLIDTATRRRARTFWADPLPDPLTVYQEELVKATCAQVEFWLEFGEEHDIVGLKGAVNLGKLQISQLPDRLAPRAYDALRRGAIITSKVEIAGYDEVWSEPTW